LIFISRPPEVGRRPMRVEVMYGTYEAQPDGSHHWKPSTALGKTSEEQLEHNMKLPGFQRKLCPEPGTITFQRARPGKASWVERIYENLFKRSV